MNIIKATMLQNADTKFTTALLETSNFIKLNYLTLFLGCRLPALIMTK